MAMKWQQKAASEKQVAFIRKLLEQKDVNANDTDMVEDALNAGRMTAGQASGLISDLLQRNNRKVVAHDVTVKVGVITPEYVTEDGMYLKDNVIYKVQFNKAQGDGRRLYAKRLEVTNESEFLADPQNVEPHVHFVYEAGAVKRLCAGDRMTMEQAKAFGALYGTCCVCGRTLTDENSIAAGIGPICAGRL